MSFIDSSYRYDLFYCVLAAPYVISVGCGFTPHYIIYLLIIITLLMMDYKMSLITTYLFFLTVNIFPQYIS